MTVPPVPLPVPPDPPDPIVETVSDADDDDDDVAPPPADVADDNADPPHITPVNPPPIVPPIADDVEYISLNAVDFTDEIFARSNPSTSADVQHLPDPDPAKVPYDSMVEATLHQLNIHTNHDDEEPL